MAHPYSNMYATYLPFPNLDYHNKVPSEDILNRAEITEIIEVNNDG